ncbi:DUF3592 domain-containing protein [Chthonomonas calidirosea]|uniref:DUF3592 domain-containing protein n=1 Tax=Chthonomonas calidirosea TaxID=454171 RepID=UPI0003A63C9D
MQGQVTQVEWTQHSGDWVHYVFQVNGSEYTGESPLGAMASPAVGQSIPIVYLPSNPHINTLANGEEADWLQSLIRALRLVQVLEVPLGVLAVGYLRYLGKRYVRGK